MTWPHIKEQSLAIRRLRQIKCSPRTITTSFPFRSYSDPQWQLFDAQRKLSTSWTYLGGLLNEFPSTRKEHLMGCDGISKRKSKARSGCPGDIVWRHHKRVFTLNWYWTRRIIKYRGKTNQWMWFFKFMSGLEKCSSLSPRSSVYWNGEDNFIFC